MADICDGLNVLELGLGEHRGVDGGDGPGRCRGPGRQGRAARRRPAPHRQPQRVPGVEPRQGEPRRRPAHRRAASSSCASLAADADVVIEGFAPGTTAAWGIGADDAPRGEPEARALLDHRVRPDRPLRRPQGLRLAGRGQGGRVGAGRLRPPRRGDHVPGPVGQLRRRHAVGGRHPRRPAGARAHGPGPGARRHAGQRPRPARLLRRDHRRS